MPQETRVRLAAAADAAAVVRMVRALNAHVGSECHFTEADYERDALGPERAFDALVAERPAGTAGDDGVLIGYAFYHPTYDTESAARGSYLMDLYVAPEARGSGAGRALLAEVASRTVAAGGEAVWWVMKDSNVLARAFYQSLSSHLPGHGIRVLAGAQLETLTNG